MEGTLNLEILSKTERDTLDATPETGFVPAFEKWAGMKTDAPAYTLKAAALQALSLAAGDQVTMEPMFSDSPVYLNLYIIVVGPSTTMRKSTVLNYVRGLLPKNKQDGKDYISFLDDVSTQAFNKVMAQAGARKAPILFSVDEVASVFEVIKKRNSYLSGFDGVLMKAYDHSPVMIHRTNSKVEAETGAYVNVFAASTPDKLMEVLNADDVESGLLPRFIIFDASDVLRGERLSLMERRKHDDKWLAKKAELQEFLYAIAKDRADGAADGFDEYGHQTYPHKVIGVTDTALRRLDALDATWTKEAGTDPTGWGAIKGRAFWHVTKLSGLYALSRAGLDAKVELIDVLRALFLVETTVGDLARMQEEVGANTLERQVNEVIELLKSTRNRRMAISAITRRMGLSAKDFYELSRTLILRDLVEADKDSAGKPYWRLSQ